MHLRASGWANITSSFAEQPVLAPEDYDEHYDPQRRLKQLPPGYCDSFRFEFAIDGVITSWNRDEFEQRRAGIQRVVEVVKISEDPLLTGGEEKEIEFAMRLSGCGIAKQFQLSHVYWA